MALNEGHKENQISGQPDQRKKKTQGRKDVRQ